MAVFFFAEPLETGTARDAPIVADGALGDEKDHPALIEHGDPHPGPELESLTSTTGQHELNLLDSVTVSIVLPICYRS